MSKPVHLSIILIFIWFGIQSQTATIEGIAMQADSFTILPGVNIALEKTKCGATTNGSGNYRINNVPAGNYILVVSSLGYITIRKEVTLKANESRIENFYLTETITTLGEVAVMTNGNKGLKDIPGSVQYITPKEIQKFSYTDINRILATVPGINIQEEDGFGLRPNIGLRGTGVERSSKITIMEDGVLIAPAPYSDPAAYYFPTIGRMQAAEVLKGSSQIKYGPFTTGGAINFVSTQIPSEFSGRINLLGGSFGGKNLHAFVGNSYKNVAYMVETFQYGSDGFKQLDGGGSTGFDKKDYLAKFSVFTDTSAKTFQSLTFKIGQVSEVSNETYLGLSEDDFKVTPFRRYYASQKDLMKTSQSQFSITHVLKLSKNLQFTTVLYRTDFKRNWYKLDRVKDSTGARTSIADLLENPTGYYDAYQILKGTNSTTSNALSVRANNRSYQAQGVQSNLSYQFKTQKIKHFVDFGFRFHTDQIDRFQWDDEYAMNAGVMQLTKSGVHGTESNRINSANAFATYIQYKIKYLNFTVTPGIRNENIEINAVDYGKNNPGRVGNSAVKTGNKVSVFIPGIGIDYQFSRFLSAFAGVHKGFSPPGPKNETKPEESVNYEVGVRYTKKSLSGQAVVFFNDYRNLLGADVTAAGGTGTGDLYNFGKVQSQGLEFQVSYNLLSVLEKTKYSLPLSISYTYTDAIFGSSFTSTFEDWGTVTAGDHLPYTANHQFSGTLALEQRKFGINLNGRYMDAMRTIPSQGVMQANHKTDAFFVVDASASYNLDKNISLFANCTNLTNAIYVVARRPSGLRPGMPRAFNVGLKANF